MQRRCGDDRQCREADLYAVSERAAGSDRGCPRGRRPERTNCGPGRFRSTFAHVVSPLKLSSIGLMTQDEALEILKSGVNAFLTGEPGSGKTHVTRRFIDWLHDKGIPVAITASTGIAATQLDGGQTIHSWSGVGMRDKLTAHDLRMITRWPNVVKRVEAAQVLIIDEVSMLSGRLLSAIDKICREIRGSGAPSAGCKSCCRRLLSTPPVIKNLEQEVAVCVLSWTWDELDLSILYLTEQHRQSEPEFTGLLSSIRANHCYEDHRLLRSRQVQDLSTVDVNSTTQLFTHRADVDAINRKKLDELPGEASVPTLKCPKITHATSNLSRAARARLIFSRMAAPRPSIYRGADWHCVLRDRR